MSETDTLIQRLKDDVPEAWNEILEQYYERIVLFCGRYVQDPGEAGALAHDTFIKAKQKIHTYASNSSLSGWLYAIARNTSLDFVRRDKRYNRGVSISPSQTATGRMILNPTEDGPGPRTVAHKRDTYRALLECVDSLPPIHAEVIMLRYMDNLSRAEIAELLEVPENTVKSRLLNALRKLRENVPEELFNFD